MTDGGASYPSQGIANFQSMMHQFPKKFIYSGIQFQCSNSVMGNISTALQGRTLKASNFGELVQAYQQCIEIIAYREP